jgi:excisionase family DNA binding protein
MTKPQVRLLKTKQAADYLNVSPWLLCDLVHRQQLPVISLDGAGRMWRFDIDDLDAYIAARRAI